MNHLSFQVNFLLLFMLFTCHRPVADETGHREIAREMEALLKTNLLESWYPISLDTVHGGFLSALTYDFKPMENQEKMVVTQARHLWTNSKAAVRYPENDQYLKNAKQGFEFLKSKMWDKDNGGFYWLVDRAGNVKRHGIEEKTAYGNTFAIYGLVAYYVASKDTSALDLAKKTFYWMDDHAHDSIHGGYYQYMTMEGDVMERPAGTPSTSTLGYKDQNSSIHLLEAFTELYDVWPDELLAERTKEMLYLIRDTIVTEKGFMNLFFLPDWTPVSYQDSSRMEIEKNHHIDHVSFGHDVETAYLMLEAQHVLGIEDERTVEVAKKMVDHALANGWDNEVGGFYDEGYYFQNDFLTITYKTKNWWSQAEGLNSLLLMHYKFPNDENVYDQRFLELWDYIKANLIDLEHGGWYEGGIDRQPEMKVNPKGHIWKATYHNYRALENCIELINSNL